MDDLGFVCAWGKDKKKSWSGTHYGLYSNLSKVYNIIDVDVGGKKDKVSILERRIAGKFRQIFGLNDMNMAAMQRGEKIAAKTLYGKCYPIIQFDECPYDYKGKQYIYQDFSVECVKKLAIEEPEVFKISRYKDIKLDVINKREQYQRTFYENVDGIFTMGKWLAKDLMENYGIAESKVFHVGGGINIDASKIDHSKKSGNKVLFVGRDFERKNGPLVIEAFKLARKSRPDLELYIAGPKKKAPMEDGIVFLGDVSSENLPDIFNICDVFCMPSKLEAYGLVFVEALSFGLPCIGKNAYEMPYFIENGKTGYLLESDSAETLSRLLIDAINNEEMKRNVVDRQEFYIKEYSWKTVCERIYNAIELTK